MRPFPRRRLSRAVLTTLVLALAAPSFAVAADDEEDWARTGPYFGVSAVGGTFITAPDNYEKQFVALGLETLPVPPLPAMDNDLDHDAAAGFDIYLGWRLHKYVAAELEVEYLPEVEFDENAGDFVEAETLVFSGAVRGILPLGRFEPYVLGGIGFMDADVDDVRNLGVILNDGVGLAIRVGGGFDFHLHRNVALRFSTEWMLPRGDIHEMEYVSIGGGLQYRF